eukprot:COSAG03_NODE_1729_length_3596_cov_3.943094_7_plen_183_part_00
MMNRLGKGKVPVGSHLHRAAVDHDGRVQDVRAGSQEHGAPVVRQRAHSRIQHHRGWAVKGRQHRSVPAAGGRGVGGGVHSHHVAPRLRACGGPVALAGESCARNRGAHVQQQRTERRTAQMVTAHSDRAEQRLDGERCASPQGHFQTLAKERVLLGGRAGAGPPAGLITRYGHHMQSLSAAS